MTLQSGEAAVLIVRRSETEPAAYFFAVRRSRSSFHQATNDFQLHGFQEPLLELGNRPDFEAALDEAVNAMKALRP